MRGRRLPIEGEEFEGMVSVRRGRKQIGLYHGGVSKIYTFPRGFAGDELSVWRVRVIRQTGSAEGGFMFYAVEPLREVAPASMEQARLNRAIRESELEDAQDALRRELQIPIDRPVSAFFTAAETLEWYRSKK